MKTYQAKKIFNGYVSVRDYLVNECLQNHESLRVVYGDKQMTISPQDLIRKAEQLTKEPMLSKWGGSYKLIDYRFEADRELF